MDENEAEQNANRLLTRLNSAAEKETHAATNTNTSHSRVQQYIKSLTPEQKAAHYKKAGEAVSRSHAERRKRFEHLENQVGNLKTTVTEQRRTINEKMKLITDLEKSNETLTKVNGTLSAALEHALSMLEKKVV